MYVLYLDSKKKRLARLLRRLEFEVSWSSECWALKTEDRRKLEVAHHRFLRSMLHVTIYDVKDDRISNDEVRRRMGIYPMESILGIRRARWIEKLANLKSTRTPRRILHAWMPTARPTGKPKQTTRKSYVEDLKNIGTTSELKVFIPLARDRKTWGDMVECGLGLAPGTYMKYSKRRRSGYRGGITGRGTSEGHQTATPTNEDIYVYDPLGAHRYMSYQEGFDQFARERGYDNAEVMFQTRVNQLIQNRS